MKIKENFLRLFFLLSITCVLGTTVNAQDGNTVLSILQGKKWRMATSLETSTKKSSFAESKYEKNKVKHYFNDKYIGEEEYYLSDSVVTVFDPNKVGKVFNGRYIIRRMLHDKPKPNSNSTRINILEIIELDSNKLVLRNIKRPNILLEYKAK